MDWVEWLLSREFRQFVLDHGLFIPLLFAARVVVVTGIEWLTPARNIPDRWIFATDLVGCTLVGYILVPASQYLSNLVAVRPVLPEFILTLPTAATFFLYYVVGDFGAYWMHRFMHLKPVWRVHKWHHSPTTMYWLAGYRASLPQQTMFNLPWIFAYAVFGMAPWWMYLAVMSSHMLLNDWMHMNVSWRSNWLEWVFVTPRYHHIHHSDDPAHANANFGVTFSIWDRLFGTYVAPETIRQPISFGIGEKVPLVRLVAGL
jgi:sterol desaturase/sphingolipid hydroxylase (fatty acid hydroxylase superfamily)